MEGLVSIEAHPVGGSVLVGVLVLLSFPVLSVPELSVTFIPGRICVRSLGNDQLCTVFKGAVWVPRSQVWSVVHLWALEAGPGSCCEVIHRLMVGSGVHHGSGAVTTRSGVEGCVRAGDLAGVESRQGQLWISFIRRNKTEFGYEFDYRPNAHIS